MLSPVGSLETSCSLVELTGSGLNSVSLRLMTRSPEEYCRMKAASQAKLHLSGGSPLSSFNEENSPLRHHGHDPTVQITQRAELA